MASHSTSARCKITKYWVHFVKCFQNLQFKCKQAKRLTSSYGSYREFQEKGRPAPRDTRL